jgi:hypothetical protein
MSGQTSDTSPLSAGVVLSVILGAVGVGLVSCLLWLG